MSYFSRQFTAHLQEDANGSCDVFSSVEMENRTVTLKDNDGSVIFLQSDVVVPSFWSETATTILATKYFRGALNSTERESSLEQVVERITGAIARTFVAKKYGTKREANILKDELAFMLVHQIMAFNSPVWFNVGVPDAKQQVSACFILDVDDTMESILNWYREEGLIFRGGSGAGVNLSKIRSSKELLTGGGVASGPVSFMRGADASAGTIKSGGKTRRAAKMVVLDADHPDIEEFIWCKVEEEKKIRALALAGFDVGFDGKDLVSIQYQNANNSVRVTDTFMHAVLNDENWDLIARSNGAVLKTLPARDLWRQVAAAAWECADPGVQFDTNINYWNTTPLAGRIDASNPCSEHMRLANSSCNLASINLLKFLLDTKFDIESYIHACNIAFIAQNVLIDLADFPTDEIRQVTHRYRDLGLGYANLGALLMSMGYSYDSGEGRAIAASLAAILTATGYKTSSALAKIHGAYEGYEKEATRRVLDAHTDAAKDLRDNGSLMSFATAHAHDNDDIATLTHAAFEQFVRARSAVTLYGARNAQISVLAPTGTIGLLMGCDTTGVEPAFDLVTHKKLVGGGYITSYLQCVERGLKRIGIESVEECTDVFMTAAGEWPLSPDAHVLMMAAIQPFISGAISKTVNLPNSATIDDIERIYTYAWSVGVKSIAVYRDGCKAFQPLSGSQVPEKDSNDSVAPETVIVHSRPAREKLPQMRRGVTRAFHVGELEGYITSGEYDDGRLGEVFIRVSKQGSTLAGIVDAFSIAVSLGLQHGVPLNSYVEKFTGMKFEPAGMTNDADIRIASSLLDYVFKRLAIDYSDAESRNALGIFSSAERVDMLSSDTTQVNDNDATAPIGTKSKKHDAPICFQCGSFMRPSGACHVCESCGSTSGCS